MHMDREEPSSGRASPSVNGVERAAEATTQRTHGGRSDAFAPHGPLDARDDTGRAAGLARCGVSWERLDRSVASVAPALRCVGSRLTPRSLSSGARALPPGAGVPSRVARRPRSDRSGASILGACALIVGCSGSPVPADASTTPRTDDAAAPADASGLGRDISVPAVADVVPSDVTGPGVDVSSLADVAIASDGATTRRCAGSYTVRSDAELGELRGCSEIEGSLDVRGPVSTLEPLSSLTRVGGSLEVRNLPSLPTLRGLERLTAVGGHFELRQNDALSTLEGLERLSSVGSYIELRQNAVLTSADGLSSLASVSGYFEIVLNPRLTSVAGMRSLRAVGVLTITNNPMLPQCQASQLAAQANVPCGCSYNLMSGACP